MRTLLVGAGTALFGLGSYLAGLFVAFPGRAFSLPVVMIGVTLTVIGREPRGSTA